MPKIFISHAHADKDLVSPFVHNILQLGGGVQDNDIFYTSERDKGIQEGKNFIDELRKHLKDAPLVIMMLSPNYFNSQFCLGELGATWVLDCPIFPIVIPDMKIEDIEGILQVNPMGMINDKEYLETLFPKLTQDNSRIIAWNRHSNEFQKLLPTLLESLPKPQIILYTKYEALQNELESAKKRIHEQQATIKKLNKLIEQIENESDYEKIQDIIFRSSSLSEQFEKLIENAKNALSSLEGHVRDIIGLVLFYWFRDGRCWGIYTRNWNTAALNVAESLGFIISEEVDGLGTYIPNKTKLGYVIAEFEKLFEYPGDFDYENDPFIKGFSDKYGCEFIDEKGNAGYKTDGEFWKDYLGIKFPR